MVRRFRMIAGSNGSGKSMLVQRLRDGYSVNFYTFVNADEILAQVSQTGGELVFTRRFLCFWREVRVPRAGALAIEATWKKLPAVAVLLPDGTSRHLLSDLPEQTARWLIAWLNERLVCRWKRDHD